MDFSFYPLMRGVRVMAMPVVEFSREGYKIRRFLAKNQHTHNFFLNFANYCSGEVSKSENI